jgi:hypothetical protein
VQDVQERRADVRRYNTDPEYKKKVDEEKRARAKAARAADPEVNAFNIIIPLAPFGIPGAARMLVLINALFTNRRCWCSLPPCSLTGSAAPQALLL